MPSADAYINDFGMEPHPEGGFYRRLHTSSFLFSINEERKASSSVLYLLKGTQKSLFHRIDAEEVWYHKDGAPMVLHLLYPDATAESVSLDGINHIHFYIPPGTWMAAEPLDKNGFSCVICHVTPEFLFEGFQLAEKNYLLERYPDYSTLINAFTEG